MLVFAPHRAACPEATMKIEDIDSNFKPATVGDKEVHYLNAIQAPFSLEGFPWGDPAKG